MKSCEIIFSHGRWLTEGNEGFDGNSDEAQNVISTQKFTRGSLPEGSVIKIDKGYVCNLSLWTEYPGIGTKKVISGDNMTEITVDSSFWGDATLCAFDVTASAEGFTTDGEKTFFCIDVPETTPKRREFTWNADSTLSILTVGNSFSDDAVEYIWQIAKSAGVKNVILGNLSYPSCRLSWHYHFWETDAPNYEYRVNTNGKWITTAKSTFEDAFGTCDWDFISFQESAQEIQSKLSLYDHLSDLIAMAKQRCPGAKFVWHMPWSNPHPNYHNSTELMYRDTMATLRMILENYTEIEEIITTGTGIQNARTSYIASSEYIRDGWHLSRFGRYIAGLTFFTQITGLSVEHVTYKPDEVSEEYRKIAIEAAMNAAVHPRTVTQSVYNVNPVLAK